MQNLYIYSLILILSNFYLKAQDVVPTINSELNVNAQGAFTFTVPIEVFKGVNNFQPNLALGYNSDSGIGGAGFGWNIIGLSFITQGGTSKRIDGIRRGPSFDESDPYYLDGQRLIYDEDTDEGFYQTEKFSSIIIKKVNTGGYSFRVQYPDGRIAWYKEISPGQNAISKIMDSYNNEVKYEYTSLGHPNFYGLREVSYGATESEHPFKVQFYYKNRNQTIYVNRKNNTGGSNRRILDRIEVRSQQEGIYREYKLYHNLNTQGSERLWKIEVENGDGENLKPLEFKYDNAGSINLTNSSRNSRGMRDETKLLGDVAMGDFYGDGEITATYVLGYGEREVEVNGHVLGTTSRKILNNSKNGVIMDQQFNTELGYKPDLFKGKAIKNDGKISKRDLLLEIHGNEALARISAINNSWLENVKTSFKFRDLLTQEEMKVDMNLPTGYTVKRYNVIPGILFYEQLDIDPDQRQYIVQDFNNDGLEDVLVFQHALKSSPNPDLDLVANNYLQTYNNESYRGIYFYEIGKNAKNGGSDELHKLMNHNQIDFNNKDSRFYPIEFDGDGTPEILHINAKEGYYDVLKFSFNESYPHLWFMVEGERLQHFTDNLVNEDTYFMVGDFNGDGLTDIIFPEKKYELSDNCDLNCLKEKIKNEDLNWRYIENKGARYDFTVPLGLDFSDQKIAHCVPSSKNYYTEKKRSFWQNLWSHPEAQYGHSEYAACGIMPIDFNNDGRTDLITFSKFGEITFQENLEDTNPTNRNFSENFTNKVRFHENVYDEIEVSSAPDLQVTLTIPTFKMETLPNQVDLSNRKISPFSFFINSQENKHSDSFNTKLVLHDAQQKKDLVIDFSSKAFMQNYIKEVDNHSGVVQKIQYEPLNKKVNGASNLFYQYKEQDFQNIAYPYYIHQQIPSKMLVARVTNLWDNKSITKEYRYQNAIQHLDDLGYLGFQKTYSSDAYESELREGEYLPKNIHDGIFWTINTHDPTLENQLVKTSYGGLGSEFFTESTFTYQKFSKSNHRYLYLNIHEEATDHLKGITINKTHSYTNDLLLASSSTQYNDTGTVISSFEYQPPWSYGEHFYHGRIKKATNTTNAYGDTFTTRDEYSNFNNAGIPLIHKKYGNQTEAITTTNTYDSFGNKLSETISTSGVSDLTSLYTYDDTKRYITKVTDPEGLHSSAIVNINGWAEEETSTLGLTTTHSYDSWGNPLTSTDYLGVTTTLVKEQLSDGKYSLSTSTPNTPTSIVIFDRFDREIQTKTQSINNQWVIKDTEYDVFGKKIRASEPYFEGESTTLWNTTEYDELDRPIKQTMYTGKVVTTCYEGLTVTVEDDEQKHTKALDAMGNTVYHKDFGGAINYSYYANGTLKEADYEGIKIKVEQDGWGRKTKLDDPSAGIYEYEYDALGRKLKEITPKGETTYVYDEFGKLLVENTVGDYTSISAQYEYDPTTKLPIKIIGNNGTDNFVYETEYDQYFRVKKKTERHPEFTYTSETFFDDSNNGRPDVIKNITTISTNNKTAITEVKNVYDNTGFKIELKNNLNGQTLWTIDEINEKGQTTQARYGNGYQLNQQYDQYFMPESSNHQNTSSGEVALNIDYTFNNVKGLLIRRNNHLFGKDETFEYDELYRLTKEILNGNIQNQYAFDRRGRITHNTEIGKYEYNNNYQFTKLGLNVEGKQLKDNRGFANVTYNSYKKAVKIHIENQERIDFEYNLFKDRTAMYYGSEAEDKTLRPLRKYYSSDKAVEIKHDTQTNTWEVFTYLDGDPYSANVLQKNTFVGSANAGQVVYYLHRDFQSTILGVSDGSGILLEKRFFDAWGNLKQAWNINDGNTNTLVFLDRGYTGHEHLESVGLIHMNGRLYDAKLRRFLSPDNFVQDPYNTQNYNRYQYAFNNPFMYTDPTGEAFQILGSKFLAKLALQLAVATTLNSVNNLIQGQPFWYGLGKTLVITTVTAGFTSQAGAAIDSWGISSGLAREALRAGVHGYIGGFASVARGGTFESGFASGAVSSLIGSAVQTIHDVDSMFEFLGASKSISDGGYTAIMYAAGGLSGGLSSSIAGGNFWEGAQQGLITVGFNHLGKHALYNPKAIYNRILKMLPDNLQKQVKETVAILRKTVEDFRWRKVAVGLEFKIAKSASGGAGGHFGGVKGNVIFLGGKDAGYVYTYYGGEAGAQIESAIESGLDLSRTAFVGYNLIGDSHKSFEGSYNYIGASVSLDTGGEITPGVSLSVGLTDGWAVSEGNKWIVRTVGVTASAAGGLSTPISVEFAGGKGYINIIDNIGAKTKFQKYASYLKLLF